MQWRCVLAGTYSHGLRSLAMSILAESDATVGRPAGRRLIVTVYTHGVSRGCAR
ncbi:MAG: hypothetical protein NC217_08645 [Muribaculaceae bacterium]|nr:hypothetical protein [Muribaculaceae bacterium]